MLLTGLLLLSCLNFQVTRHTLGTAEFKTARSAIEHASGEAFYRWTNADTHALRQTFIVALSKTQKFNILKRKNIKNLFSELDYRKNNQTNTIKSFKANHLKDATFLIEGEVSLFRIAYTKQNIPYSKRVQHKYSLTLIVDLSLTEIETGSIAFVDQVKVNLKTSGNHTIEDMVDSAKKQASNMLVAKLLDELYPITIIKGGNSEVYVSLSKSPKFNIGQTLEVFAVSGRPIIDPYTDEILGYEESHIGTVKITSILPKFAKADVLNLQGKTINLNAICRFPEDDAN